MEYATQQNNSMELEMCLTLRPCPYIWALFYAEYIQTAKNFLDQRRHGVYKKYLTQIKQPSFQIIFKFYTSSC